MRIRKRPTYKELQSAYSELSDDCYDLENTVFKLLEKLEAVRSIPADRLDMLADWLDLKDSQRGVQEDEVQRDLRSWAGTLRKVQEPYRKVLNK